MLTRNKKNGNPRIHERTYIIGKHILKNRLTRYCTLVPRFRKKEHIDLAHFIIYLNV